MTHLSAAGVPVNSNTALLTIAVSSALAAAIIGLNFLALKRRSTCRAAVFGVVCLILGVMVWNVANVLQFTADRIGFLHTVPGLVSLGLIVAALILAVTGWVQFVVYHRCRRGKKRAVATFIFSLVGLGFLVYADYQGRHPVKESESESPAEPTPAAETS